MSTPAAAADVSVTVDDQPTTYSGAALVEAGRRLAGAVAQAVQGLGQLGRAMNGTASGHFRSKLELRPAPPVLREPLPLRESMMLLQSSVEAREEQRDEMRPNRYDSLRAQVVVDFAYVRPRRTLVTSWHSRRPSFRRFGLDWNYGDRRALAAYWNSVGWRDVTTTEFVPTAPLTDDWQPPTSLVVSAGQSYRVVGVSTSVLTLDRRPTRVEPRQVTGRQPKLPKSRRRKRR